MAKSRTLKISIEARKELARRVAKDPDLYKGRGMTGALDYALFGKFTTTGRGNNWGGKKV